MGEKCTRHVVWLADKLTAKWRDDECSSTRISVQKSLKRDSMSLEDGAG